MKLSAKSKLNISLDGTDLIKGFGNSMYPVLHHGDVVHFKKIPLSSIKINDIIVAKNKNKFITHRVIYKTKQHLITKGDNNKSIDPKILPKHIVGKVHKITRNGTTFHPDTLYLMQSTLYLRHIGILLSKLKSAKIQYVLLKGLLLHLVYTNSHPRRRYLDFDILIHPKDEQRIYKILHNLQYEEQHEYFSKIHEKLIDRTSETTFIKPTKSFPIVVDVHFEPVFMMTQTGTLNAIYPTYLLDKFREQLLQNAQEVEIYHKTFNILSLSDLILYLALHFFHHNYKGLHRLELLDAVIRQIPKNKNVTIWKKIEKDISDYKLKGYVYGPFVSCRSYFKTPIPMSFIKIIRPSDAQRKYIKTFLKKRSVFDGDNRITEGVQLFRNLFYLSPRPFVYRFFVFLKPSILYMFGWLIYFTFVNSSKKLLLEHE